MRPFAPAVLILLAACGRLEEVGKAPAFSPLETTVQHHAMYNVPLPLIADPGLPADAASLWAAGRAALFDDRRAVRRGDILTVVVEIDDRAEISNFIKDNNITGVFGMHGDAHMLAYDDGRNNNYANGGGPNFPTFNAAAMDRSGSTKGGPYSGGTIAAGGQYGLMFAGYTISAIPLGVLFMFCTRLFMKGITSGALKA